MKKIVLACLISAASSALFAQTQHQVIAEAAKDPKAKEMSAVADTRLTDKKEITDDSKKRKARRPKVHKECSRMKS